MSYTREGLKKLVAEFGFEHVGEEENIHVYPAFCMRFAKPGPHKAAWEYAFDRCPVKIDPKWNCLEVGSGSNPWPRANMLVDIDEESVALPDQKFIKADAADMKEIGDKEFDFLISAHMIEHCEDPFAVAKEFSRVAKRGLIICPSWIKDPFFGYEEADHVWQIRQRNDRLVFMRTGEVAERLRDADFTRAMHRLLRLGPSTLGEDSLTIRKWFRRNEKWLDVVFYWEGELRVEVERED